MPRLPKKGEFINCKIDIELVKKLNDYSQKTRIPKTAIIEMALEDYFKKVTRDKKQN